MFYVINNWLRQMMQTANRFAKHILIPRPIFSQKLGSIDQVILETSHDKKQTKGPTIISKEGH